MAHNRIRQIVLSTVVVLSGCTSFQRAVRPDSVAAANDTTVDSEHEARWKYVTCVTLDAPPDAVFVQVADVVSRMKAICKNDTITTDHSASASGKDSPGVGSRFRITHGNEEVLITVVAYQPPILFEARTVATARSKLVASGGRTWELRPTDTGGTELVVRQYASNRRKLVCEGSIEWAIQHALFEDTDTLIAQFGGSRTELAELELPHDYRPVELSKDLSSTK
jgi:uncharacterized protein YceK